MKPPRTPSADAPAATLILAVYQRPDVLALVLTALLGQSFDDFEIVVADDGSGPEVAAVVAAWAGRFRHPVRHDWQADEGFRKTVIANHAAAGARGELLVFLDGDCIPHHRFLERHWVRRRAGQVLSGRRLMLDAELTARLTADDVARRAIESPRFWWNHVPPHDRRNGFYLPWAFGLRGASARPYEILGSNFSLPRAAFLAVNGYDERIVKRGMEDVNLKARLVNAGFRLRAISQEALQYHCHHDSGPIDHDAASVERWGRTTETWTPFGVERPAGGA